MQKAILSHSHDYHVTRDLSRKDDAVDQRERRERRPARHRKMTYGMTSWNGQNDAHANIILACTQKLPKNGETSKLKTAEQ